MMKQRYVISLEGVWEALLPHAQHLRQFGISQKSLLIYAIHFARYGDYETMVSHVSKDLAEADLDLIRFPVKLRDALQSCLRCIEDAACKIVPLVERLCGVPFDHRIEFDQYIDNDLVLSVSSESTNPERWSRVLQSSHLI